MKNYLLLVEHLKEILLEAYKNNDKKTASKIIKEFKANSKLKTLYALLENMQTEKISKEYVDLYIQENINIAKSEDFKSLDKFLSDDLKKYNNQILEDIGCLLFDKKTVHNLAAYQKSYDTVKRNLIENVDYMNDVSAKLTEWSSKMSDFDDEDKNLVEGFIVSQATDKKEIFNKTINECIDAINKKIAETSDINKKVKLYEAKDKILSRKEIDNITEKDIKNLVEMHELRKSIIAD